MLGPLTPDFAPDDRYDVAIIGAGPAGITLAMVLANRGWRVFLAESGGLDFEQRAQDLYRGRTEGDEYLKLEESRLRQFGGSSGHWGGFCRPLDPQDFLPKAASAQTAWPIRAADLAPFANRALRLAQAEPLRPDKPLPGSDNLVSIRYSTSPPTRFGEFYRPVVERHARIDALYNCTFTGFEMAGEAVRAGRFENWDRHAISVKAERFILACGAIENCRLLLHENARHGDRLGNRTGLVGAYWSEHFQYAIGHVLALDEEPFALDDEHNARVWAPTAAFVARAGILNAAIELAPPSRSGAKGEVEDLLCLAPDLSPRLMARLGRDLSCLTQVNLHLEQEPQATNRIALGRDVDAFGTPRPVLQVRKTRLDRRTTRTMTLEVGRYLASEDIGRFRMADWVMRDDTPYPRGGEIANYHQMGGTRMAARAEDGVVDRDCRVFGTPNLYVAGSSVFPSGGHTKPTFTILQLALRLADHLTSAGRAA